MCGLAYDWLEVKFTLLHTLGDYLQQFELAESREGELAFLEDVANGHLGVEWMS